MANRPLRVLIFLQQRPQPISSPLLTSFLPTQQTCTGIWEEKKTKEGKWGTYPVDINEANAFEDKVC